MSNRSMLEFNHDKTPSTDDELFWWAKNLQLYLRSGDYTDLPDGVTFFNCRHHSEDCPMGEPPHGWENET